MIKKRLACLCSVLLITGVFSACKKDEIQPSVSETTASRPKTTNAVVDPAETTVPVETEADDGYVSLTSAVTTQYVAGLEPVETAPDDIPIDYVPMEVEDDTSTPPIEWTASLMANKEKWDTLESYRMFAIDLTCDGVPELITVDTNSEVLYDELSLYNAYVYDIQTGELITQYLDNEYSNFVKFVSDENTSYWGYSLYNDYFKFEDNTIKKLAYLVYNEESSDYTYYIDGDVEVDEEAYVDYLIKWFNYDTLSPDESLMSESRIKEDTHDNLEYYVRELLVRWYRFHCSE